MAKIKFGMMMTDARGKLGGQVFSKNRGGAYIRTKVTPSNPRTTDQQANRTLLGSLSQGWSALTSEQRLSWNNAVSAWAKTNIFGDIHNPSGKNLYVQLNKNIVAIGGAIIETAPEKVEMGILGLESVVFAVGVGSVTLNASGTASGFVLQCSATPPLTQGTTNAKNKFRVYYTIPFDDYDANDSYDNYVAKFGAVTAGANIQFSFKLVADNGQQSVPESTKAVVTA
jgi:hypothetical protein